jgi:hypothetical protein
MVRFYGDHSSSWVAAKQLVGWDESEVEQKTAALTQWGKKNSKWVPGTHWGHISTLNTLPMC